jgi:hypothetical protein|tara:strand:- start:24716 stop:26245 length:1530 start_codon:yes stop_codon:yes gene_type:complete
MSKKIKISLNSTLIEAVASKTMSIQEQYDQYLMTPDGAEEAAEMFQNVKEKEKECKACNKKALRLARKIVALDFEGWTEGDTKFYYKNEKKLCCSAVNGGMPTLIKHVEDGEPGWCDNWLHCVLPIVEVGLLFVPGIGWGLALGLSMTVGLIDAAIYYSEGEEETAGLVAFLTILPGVPGVVKKFPFVKSWAKQGTKKISEKLITGEGLSMLERYQLKALSTESSQKFLELEVKQHIKDLASKEFFGEAVEIGGKKITKEMIDSAVEKGYLEITIGGTKSKLSKEVVTALTKSGRFTAIQQLKLIKFIKSVTPFLLAGMGYFKIMNELAKSGVRGPKKLIEKLWGIDPDDTSEVKITKFFQKVSDPESEIDDNIKTKWDYIKFIFNSSGSAKDGELMVQAIKNGWNPYKEDKSVVPKKYRTEGYREWVNNILSNEALLTWFGSDGSDEDNNLLLSLIFEDPSFNDVTNVPEKYRTETYKKNLEKRKQQDKTKKKSTDDEGEEYIDLFSD